MWVLTHMQQSYRWQPHLPFMPLHLSSHPWAVRYNYTYETLPIVKVWESPQTMECNYSLDPAVAEMWTRHVSFFRRITREWRSNLAKAPMSVDNMPVIHEENIHNQGFRSEKKARGHFWYQRTLIFSLFAEFYFQAAAKSNWRSSVVKYYEDLGSKVEEGWLDEVEEALCDFVRTKRTGVIVDASTTEIWPFLPRYHHKGVPILMDVGNIFFHDHESFPRNPSIYITDVTGHTPYDIYPADWPSPELLRERTESVLKRFYDHRFPKANGDPWNSFPRHPISISRPAVEENGGVIHQRVQTSAWVNPETQVEVGFLQMGAPVPAHPPKFSEEDDWVLFFHRRREKNKKLEGLETLVEKSNRQRRLDRSKVANQEHSNGPDAKAVVYRWVQQDAPICELGSQDSWVPMWKRVKVDRKQVSEVWDEYMPSQRLYDSFHNQWDLMELFDPDPKVPEGFDEDEDHDMGMNVPSIQRNQQEAQLDQVYHDPNSDVFSNLQTLRSKISLIALANPESWMKQVLGLMMMG